MMSRTNFAGTIRFAYHTGGRGNAEIVVVYVTRNGEKTATIQCREAPDNLTSSLVGRNIIIQGRKVFVGGEVIASYSAASDAIFFPPLPPF